MMIRTLFILFFVGSLLPQGHTQTGEISSRPASFERAYQLLSTAQHLDSVSVYFAEGRATLLTHHKRLVYATHAIELAQECYRNKAYPIGLDILHTLERDLIQTEHLADQATQITIRYQLARGYFYTRAAARCIAYVQQNLPLLDRDDIAYANHHNILGLIYLRQANHTAAAQHLEEVLRVRKLVYGSNDNRVATILNNLGNAYYHQGLLPKASACYQEGLQIRSALFGEQDSRLFSLLNNLASVYSEKEELYQSISMYRRAIRILEQQAEQNTESLAILYTNLATDLFDNGAVQEAELYHQKAASIFAQLPGKENLTRLGDVYINLGNQAVYQKEYKKALQLQLQQQAIDLYTQSLDSLHPKRVAAVSNLCFRYNKQAEFNKALQLLQTLHQQLDGKISFTFLSANVLNEIGDAYLGLGQWELAKKHHLQALALQQENDSRYHHHQAYSYNQLAFLALQQNQPQQAAQHIEMALAKNDATDMPLEGYKRYDFYIESLLLKAQLLEPKAALGIYAIADRVLHQIKSQLITVEDKINFADYVYRVAEKAIPTALATETPSDTALLARAFRFSESSKANVLSQLLAIRQGKNYVGIPEDSIRLEEQLLSDINYYKIQLATDTDSTKWKLYQNELFAVQTAHQRLVEDMVTRYPSYHELKYQNLTPTLSEIQARLAPDAAMVSYFTTADELYSFVITKQQTSAHRIPIDASFTDLQTGLHKTINKRLDEDYLEVAHELYRILFSFELEDHIRQLILVPDGSLSQLPFETLLRDAVVSNTPDFSRLPYLIKDYQISYVPSARMYMQSESAAPSVFDHDLVAYAPVFEQPQGLSVFEKEGHAPLSGREEILRTLTLGGSTIASLPATKVELEQIAEVFRNQGKEAKAYFYQEASENALKSHTGQQHHFLHIATHGFVNEEQPDLSGLLFYPDTASAEDHILYTGEIYNLPLQADLVVLSACETGLGANVQGEGLLGLSRAFLYAGAQNLLVSLWKVQDQATADLMVDFYSLYWEQQPAQYGLSLRQAKLNMLASERFSHPYYWSPFILIGE